MFGRLKKWFSEPHWFMEKVKDPYWLITLQSIDDPTTAQIKGLRDLKRGDFTNFLELRSVLQEGGCQEFGLLLVDQASALSEKLTEAGIPNFITQKAEQRQTGPN
jgi:hypothetical protein